MIVIPSVIGALGTVPKGLKRMLEMLEIVERIESIQTIALLRSARILRKDLLTGEDLLWKTNEKLLTNADVKNSEE